MSDYDVTYGCGHSETVSLVGKHTERERRLAAMRSSLCPACLQAEHDKENAASAAKAAADGLPPMRGSAKQAPWAETIRAGKMESAAAGRATIEKKIIAAEAAGKFDSSKVGFTAAESRALADKALETLLHRTDASWWIDRQGSGGNALFFAEFERLATAPKASGSAETVQTSAAPLAAPAAVPAPQVITLRPESDTILESPCKLTIVDHEVRLIPPVKNEAVIALARKMNFSWSAGAWTRLIHTSGAGREDRAAELGAKLLKLGFVVTCPAAVAEKIRSASWEPEKPGVIIALQSGKVCLQWGRSEDFYKEAKRLPGARWESGLGMVVPAAEVESIRDFAHLYDFHIAEGAQALLDKALADRELQLAVDPEINTASAPDKSRPVLRPDDVGDVDPELLDAD
jgi:hypothetical protein